MHSKLLLATALGVAAISGAHAQNLVTSYNFNNQLNDASGNNFHLQQFNVNNPTAWEAGPSGNASDMAATFNGNGGLETGAPLNNTGWSACSMSVWVKSDPVTERKTIVQGAYLGFGIMLDPTGRILAFFDGSSAGSVETSSTVDDGQWHHIVAQNDGTTTTIYIDGQQNATISETLFTLGGASAQARLYLGTSNLGSGQYTGAADNFKLYDGLLTSTEVSNLYNEGLGNSTGLFERKTPAATDALQVFPNPTSGAFSIRQWQADWQQLEVRSLLGQQVCVARSGTEANALRLDALPAGVYFVAVRNSLGKTVAVQRLVKR